MKTLLRRRDGARSPSPALTLALLALLAALTLTGCGQKGPLVLPGSPAPGASAPSAH